MGHLRGGSDDVLPFEDEGGAGAGADGGAAAGVGWGEIAG